MSIIISNCQQINQSPLNNSVAKQLYSFPKAPRFPDIQKKSNEKIAYDLPSTRPQRAAGFGYGTRYDFTKGSQSPPPNAYTKQSDFVKNPHSKAFSFGISREAYDKVYVKGHFLSDKTIPGPGSYNSQQSIGADSNKFTFRPRTTNPMFETTTKNYPGPGTYDNKLEITPKGAYFLSKFKSSGATTFNPSKSIRFKDLQEKEAKNLPGPGQYAPKIDINDKGQYFVSKFKSSGVRTFSHSERNTLANGQAKNPGPGSYRLPSDFGHYESKFKSNEKDVFSGNNTSNASKSNTKGSSIMKQNGIQSLAKSSSQPELKGNI